MNYCVDEQGMNQPLTIPLDKVSSNQPFEQTTPSGGDINPTTNTPGLNFPTTSPLINITLTQPATLTLVYVPTDRPNQLTNVQQFTLIFAYPDGSLSDQYTSTPSSTSGTTAPTTSNGVVLPSNVSPQVDLPSNFDVPTGTVLMIAITSTESSEAPRGVSTHLFFLCY
jgi:hypothetical protein